ncbi:SRPBCC family protein [Streptomyces katsurahamanus]|uniref:Toxin-antitoxin system toxin subunit n=1 Tax=Streptomyces katsurahamanus TaxID=2577098 RepID=A0ABW9NWG5_9ACTN|nr:SRPBCC family protein [Streptomyces katsurahamanus]MQS37618.1 toxin-antitoxin system toxin subunit [Streptomyces katsurahamanus]
MDPHHDTLTTADDGRTVLRMERHLAHPPQEVWDALTRPERLAGWFPVEMRADPRPGGTVEFHAPGAGGPMGAGTVTDADEPRLFAYTWDGDLLRWEIAPERQGSRLTLVHTFGDRFGAASFASGWHGCLTVLGQLLDGERPTTMRDADGEVHEEYVARFGLDRGTVDAVGDGWRIRFERQLVRPAETVWAELAAGSTPLLGGPAPRGFTTPATPPGRITALRPPRLLAYACAPPGEVRWELTEGTGHGPRLILTQTGPGTVSPQSALEAWGTRIAELAARLRRR